MIMAGRGIGVVGRAAIVGLDALLRRWHHIQEFTQDKDCLLRITLARNEAEVTLSDGTTVAAGEIIGELHLWNEHIPPISAVGPDLAWGMEFYRQLLKSLNQLTHYIQNTPQFAAVRAFRGETSLPGESLPQAASLAGQMGFDLLTDSSGGKLRRFGQFWEHLYVWWLIWTFNPGSLRRKQLLRLERCQVWISRQALMSQYGKGG